MEYKLEVIAFNIESCLTIEKCGAHRIELCDNPSEGGTTPSYGLIKMAREKVSIDLFPIIRPRGGDFLYTEEEFEVMQNDVRQCKELGCDGVVIGMLEADGSIAAERIKKLVDIAGPMEVTFHRAFDRVREPFQALEDVISCGCSRILTSGLHPTVLEGKALIRQLVQQAGKRLVIMPGSGLRADNIEEIIGATGAGEFHTSARGIKKSGMLYKAQTMHEELEYAIANEKEIKKCLTKLEQYRTRGDQFAQVDPSC